MRTFVLFFDFRVRRHQNVLYVYLRRLWENILVHEHFKTKNVDFFYKKRKPLAVNV